MMDLIFQAQYCQAAGADSLLTLPELYFKPRSVDELVFYVELVAKAAPKLPVLYYHIPAMSKVEGKILEVVPRVYPLDVVLPRRATESNLHFTIIL